MSAVSAPYGFRPAFHPSGVIRPKGLLGGIASGYGANLYIGAPVIMATTGVLNAAGTSGEILGVFAGCQFTPTGGRPVNGYWPTGQTYEAGTMIAFYYDDPAIVYAVQANGSLAQTSIGDEANCVNPTAGSNYTHFSTAGLSSSLAGDGNQAQFQIVGLQELQDNAWGDAYTQVLVRIAQPQFAAVNVAI